MKTSIALKIARFRASAKLFQLPDEVESLNEVPRLDDIVNEIDTWIDDITDPDTEMKVLPIDLSLEEVSWITNILTEVWNKDLSKMLQSEYHKDPEVVRKFDLLMRLGLMTVLFQGMYDPLAQYPRNSTEGREQRKKTDASGT